MKRLLVALLLFPFVSCMAAGPRLNYVVAIAKFRQWYNEGRADSIYGMFSAKMQAALPVDKTQQLISGLHAQLGELKQTAVAQELEQSTVYRGTFEKAAMMIVFSLNEKDQLAGLFFKPAADTSAAATGNDAGEPCQISVAPGKTVYGTLTVPVSTQPVPVVLLIAGSGPTDRNGNGGPGLHTNAYKMLADSLLKSGIACLRYDKRGVGSSSAAMSSEQELRFEDMITDAVAFLKQLKSDKRFSKVVILGHSEGSLVGMAAAGKEPVAGFISLSGAGSAADIILEKQLKANAPALAAQALPVLQQLKKGKTVTVQEPELQFLFRESIQPYLISWFRYDPAALISRMTIPVCIIQGNTDMQVSEADAVLLHQAQPKAAYHLVAQMNHVLKYADNDPQHNAATYTDPSIPLHPQLAALVVDFVRH